MISNLSLILLIISSFDISSNSKYCPKSNNLLLYVLSIIIWFLLFKLSKTKISLHSILCIISVVSISDSLYHLLLLQNGHLFFEVKSRPLSVSKYETWKHLVRISFNIFTLDISTFRSFKLFIAISPCLSSPQTPNTVVAIPIFAKLATILWEVIPPLTPNSLPFW